MTEPVVDELERRRRGPEARPALDLLGISLVVAAVAMPLAQLLSAWAFARSTTFSAAGGSDEVLRAWIARVGLGPSVLLLAATLLVGLTALRPPSAASRRQLVAITVIGIAVAVAQAIGAVDALVSSMPGENGFTPAEDSTGYRLGAALGMVAAGAVAGVSAWVAFTIFEQGRLAAEAADSGPLPSSDDEGDESVGAPR